MMLRMYSVVDARVCLHSTPHDYGRRKLLLLKIGGEYRGGAGEVLLVKDHPGSSLDIGADASAPSTWTRHSEVVLRTIVRGRRVRRMRSYEWFECRGDWELSGQRRVRSAAAASTAASSHRCVRLLQRGGHRRRDDPASRTAASVRRRRRSY